VRAAWPAAPDRAGADPAPVPACRSCRSGSPASWPPPPGRVSRPRERRHRAAGQPERAELGVPRPGRPRPAPAPGSPTYWGRSWPRSRPRPVVPVRAVPPGRTRPSWPGRSRRRRPCSTPSRTTPTRPGAVAGRRCGRRCWTWYAGTARSGRGRLGPRPGESRHADADGRPGRLRARVYLRSLTKSVSPALRVAAVVVRGYTGRDRIHPGDRRASRCTSAAPPGARAGRRHAPTGWPRQSLAGCAAAAGRATARRALRSTARTAGVEHVPAARLNQWCAAGRHRRGAPRRECELSGWSSRRRPVVPAEPAGRTPGSATAAQPAANRTAPDPRGRPQPERAATSDGPGRRADGVRRCRAAFVRQVAVDPGDPRRVARCHRTDAPDPPPR
jgi:hypothetical protein